jgi:hypothetical protein
LSFGGRRELQGKVLCLSAGGASCKGKRIVFRRAARAARESASSFGGRRELQGKALRLSAGGASSK